MKKVLRKIVPGLFLLLMFLLMRTDNAWAEEPTPNYLTFTALEDNSSITFSYTGVNNVMFKLNDSDWKELESGQGLQLEIKGDKVSFKGTNIKTDMSNHFSMTGKIAASGSVTSLTDGNGGTSKVYLTPYCYSNMFDNCSSLTSAPELPAEHLAEGCYAYMFCGCSSLTSAPELNATELATSCYSTMFEGCSSLTSAPELPATELKENCYGCMFDGCSSLTSAPELNATELARLCYFGMFNGCSSLTSVPKLPAEHLAADCYGSMFYECPNLKIAREKIENEGIVRKITIPAYDAEGTCFNMFSGAGTESSVPEELRVPSTPYKSGATYYTLADTFSITYVLNGGIQTESNPTEYFEGLGIKSFKNPTREGYVFDGWYKDDKFTEQVTEITTDCAENITLYAKWVPNKYAITYVLNGGTQATGNPTEYIEGEGIQSFKSPTRSGYTFMGWFADSAFTKEVKEISTEAEGDITLYAKWLKNPYTEKITVKNVTYQISFDSYDKVTSVALTKFSDKKATSVNIGKFKYNGKSYSVTEIGDNAFKNNKKLKTVTIGSSVKTIGKSAFSGCTALTSVKSGSKVTEIKASAFSGCKKLKSITLASGLKTIGSSAFTNCKALTKVTIGSKVNSIGSKAFKGCSALKSVTIKTTLLTDKNVGKEAFSGINSKATVKVPAKKLASYKKLLKKKGIKGKNQKIKK